MNVSALEQKHRETLVKLVFELACDCPSKLQPNCPLTKSRELNREELYNSIVARSTRELDYLYQAHLDCLKKQSLTSDKVPIKELYV